MYPPGHVGITALLLAPLIVVLFAVANTREVVGWVCLAIVLTLVPDVDAFIPGVAHRGVTHTFLAAVVLGAVVAVVVRTGGLSSTRTRTKRTVLGFLAGAGAVVSHLLGDVITPMGIRPLSPFQETVYTLDVVRASDPRANLSLLLVGVTALAVAYRTAAPVPSPETDSPSVEAEESTTPTS